ncbi:MAG: hypothetical protein V1849_05595 [Chloroflexota bacterium]
MDRTWIVEIQGKKHLIEVGYGWSATGTHEKGKLVVDKNEVRTWDWSQAKDLPEEVSFEIGGKPAVLRSKGLFSPKLELFFEGRKIKPSKHSA